ncbi:hypothetical protein F0562_006176 [Nyssa sinensis]|uniref:Rhamnogalacturonan endolyase n=1 Tax=Nyssa sinensis TaxID=561372 RepID=A0A5J5AR22_9ASTE|nr:hypothetical protein F0562_006176 [Nyssa sinensis]
MDNGIVKVTLSTPKGLLTGIQYNGIENLLAYNKESNRGLDGTSFRVIKEDENQIELSFTKTWNSSLSGSQIPLNIDKRFIMLHGQPGFYSYAILERLEGWPDLNLDQGRISFKLQQKLFDYMAISDERQRVMPTERDRVTGKVLDYREAVLLTNPANPKLKGEVDDKYQYSSNNKDNRVHGWICSDPATGFWVITPSDEFRVGGLLKQELTSHVGPNQLSEDYPHADRRGVVSGRLLIRDKYINKELKAASSAYVGLAAPGDAGSWQTENKDYQFWTQANADGYFLIKGVRAGNYNLYAWVPGILGDYKYDTYVDVTPGHEIKLGTRVYDPPRIGPTLWEIGIPDRTAAEFYVPDPKPTLTNRLYVNHKEKYRQYGLWKRYTDLYPDQDLVYTVGVSKYQTDWFFAHVTRNIGNKTYESTTWKILFDIQNVKRARTYTLRLALASANAAELQVRINNPHGVRPHFTTGLIGRDNAIARHGIHGFYWFYSVGVPGFRLRNGRNTIYLRQSRGSNPFRGIMYDYIRLEGPPNTN